MAKDEEVYIRVEGDSRTGSYISSRAEGSGTRYVYDGTFKSKA